MMTERIVTLLDQWITADRFEQALRQTSTPSFSNSTKIIFRFPSTCKMMVEAAACLLSFANQIVAGEPSVHCVQ